ncbi:hypothetical protein TSUD_367260 [Trifolium subterraneum]|uniref:Rx N-terminal domain-containing protein n=1 Tax=Trifolium subterraneum TaxID=3900 RepID=A0A2Z6P0R2_TRISU|nr:hypothetical protein TSUD_367260 [Trifolium subterraneum]
MDQVKLSKRIEQLIAKLDSVDDICCARLRGHNVTYLVLNMQQIQFKAECAEREKECLGTNTPKVKIWIDRVKHTLDDVDHLLDESSKEDLKPHYKKNKKLHIFFSSLKQLAFDLKLADKIKDLTTRMKSLRKFNEFTNQNIFSSEN